MFPSLFQLLDASVLVRHRTPPGPISSVRLPLSLPTADLSSTRTQGLASWHKFTRAMRRSSTLVCTTRPLRPMTIKSDPLTCRVAHYLSRRKATCKMSRFRVRPKRAKNPMSTRKRRCDVLETSSRKRRFSWLLLSCASGSPVCLCNLGNRFVHSLMFRGDYGCQGLCEFKSSEAHLDNLADPFTYSPELYQQPPRRH